MSSSGKVSLSLKKKTTTYGLVIPKKKAVSNKKGILPNVFGAAEDQLLPDKGGDSSLINVTAAARAKRIKLAQEKALVEDPSVFDYDSVYDDIKKTSSSSEKERRCPEKKASRYISSLVETAKVRNIEHERIRERVLAKEREAEDAIYGDKESFVTRAYKSKLEERKVWEEVDAREKSSHHDQPKDMSNFYAKLKSSNIAMGSDVAANATSAYTVGHERKDAGSSGTMSKQNVDDTASEQSKEDIIVKSEDRHHHNNVTTTDKNRTKTTVTAVTKDAVQEARERYLKRKRGIA